MTITTTLTDGTQSISLVYDGTTQANYKQVYGSQVASRLPAVIEHQPDFGAPLPIDGWDTDRQVFLTMDVVGDDWDDILNKIATLKRMVDGASSQALRYWTVGDVNRVNLQLSVGQTNTTNIPVKFGLVDDSAAYYRGEAYLNTRARLIVVSLVVSPYGEGDEITLANEFANPAFLVESGTAGLAAAWAKISDVGYSTLWTATLDTTYYLVGGQSQKMATGAVVSDSMGLQYGSFLIGGGVQVAAYVWVTASATTDDVLTIQALDDGGNNATAVEFNPANPAGYDKITTDATGKMWYRYTQAFTTAGGATVLYFNIVRASGDYVGGGTYYIDAAYCHTGSLVLPDAWASYKAIKNRNDTTATNYNNINYMLLWGVPGDASPHVNHSVTASTTAGSYEYFYLTSRNNYDPSIDTHYIEGESAGDSDATNGAWNLTNADATASNGKTARFTSSASGGLGEIEVSISNAQYPMRVFARAKASVNNYTMTIRRSLETLPDIVKIANEATLTTSYGLYDLGLVYDNIPPSKTSKVGAFTIYVSGATAASQTADIDYILCLPTNSFLVARTDIYTGSMSGGAMSLNQSEGYVYVTHNNDFIGNFPSAIAGNSLTQIIYVRQVFAAPQDAPIGDTFTISLSVIPRTRHLLGTQ